MTTKDSIKQAGEWLCPNCGDTVDLDWPSEPWPCSYCGETMQPRSKTDVTPNDELRALIEQWREEYAEYENDPSQIQNGGHQMMCRMNNKRIDELESVLRGEDDSDE